MNDKSFNGVFHFQSLENGVLNGFVFEASSVAVALVKKVQYRPLIMSVHKDKCASERQFVNFIHIEQSVLYLLRHSRRLGKGFENLFTSSQCMVTFGHPVCCGRTRTQEEGSIDERWDDPLTQQRRAGHRRAREIPTAVAEEDDEQTTCQGENRPMHVRTSRVAERGSYTLQACYHGGSEGQTNALRRARSQDCRRDGSGF